MYANGYRIDFIKREITKTGVLTIESDPTGASLFINNKEQGKTPKSSSLEIGKYNISIKKDKYNDWNKSLDVLEGKSTPIFPWLVLKEPKKEELWKSETPVLKSWLNETKDHFIFLTENTDKTFSLWEYSINTPFWDLSTNPSVFLTLKENVIDLTISPNGQKAILKINDSKSKPLLYVLETQISNSLDTLIPLDIKNLETYNLTWSKDNKSLILESNTDISIYNTSAKTTVKIIDKVPTMKYLWTTDEKGFLYILEPIVSDKVYTYKLKQYEQNGINAKYLINTFSFQKSDQYINEYRKNGFAFVEYTSSEESTFSGGDIVSMIVNQDAKGIYIKTTLATYWYNMTTEKFMMISAYPAELISFSPDITKLIFREQLDIGVFIFDKEEADHTQVIGSKKLQNTTETISDISWLSNSLYISYKEGAKLYSCDIDGENKTLILENQTSIGSMIKDALDNVIDFNQSEDKKITISQFNIH